MRMVCFGLAEVQQILGIDISLTIVSFFNVVKFVICRARFFSAGNLRRTFIAIGLLRLFLLRFNRRRLYANAARLGSFRLFRCATV